MRWIPRRERNRSIFPPTRAALAPPFSVYVVRGSLSQCGAQTERGCGSGLATMTDATAREKWLIAEGHRYDFDDRPGREGGSAFAEYDLLGRKQPRVISIPDYLLMVARIDPARVRRVPAAAITEEGLDDQGEFAYVACPCEAHPVVRGELEQCTSCERRYVLVGTGAVFVAYGAMEPPPLGKP